MWLSQIEFMSQVAIDFSLLSRPSDAHTFFSHRPFTRQVLLRSDCAFKAGEFGRDMYFIQKGFIQITGDAKLGQGDLVFCTLLAGSFFGELAMFTQQRRTATARAASDCILFHMSHAGIQISRQSRTLPAQ